MSSTDDPPSSAQPDSGPPDTEARVLHVDDDAAFAELTATHLEREGLDVAVETDPEAALDRLDQEPFDCVVSDFDMPAMDGLDLLDAVREGEPEPHRPFILFTGKGSEQIASRAISAGVTDYLQKGSGETYDLLANRVRNAVEAYRSQVLSNRCRQVVQSLEIPIAAVDADGHVLATNQAMLSLTGRQSSTLEGAPLTAVVDRAGVEAVVEAVGTLHAPDGPRSLQRTVTVETEDGDQRLPVTLNRLETAEGEPAVVCLFGG